MHLDTPEKTADLVTIHHTNGRTIEGSKCEWEERMCREREIERWTDGQTDRQRQRQRQICVLITDLRITVTFFMHLSLSPSPPLSPHACICVVHVC